MSDDKIKDALKMMPYGFYSFTTRDSSCYSHHRSR